MKRDAVRDALGILVSIDSAETEGYEIVASRKVDKDVYELVLAKPSTRPKSGTDGSRGGTGQATDVLDGSRGGTGHDDSSARTTWVVKSPVTEPPPAAPAREVRTTKVPVAPTVASVATAVPSDTVVTDLAESPPASSNGAPELGDTGTDVAAAATTTAAPTTPPLSLADDDTPESALTTLAEATPTPVSLADDEPAATVATPSSLSDDDSPSHSVRVAPRVPTPAPPAPSTPKVVPPVAMPTPPARTDEAPSKAPTSKRRPFARAPKDDTPTAPAPGKKSPAPAEPSGHLLTRKLSFSRSKDQPKSAAKAAPAPAPIRPPTVARPRVEIDPRTGRPVHDPNSPLMDASRKNPAEVAAESTVVDTTKGSGRRGRGRGDDAGSPGEPRQSSEFQDHLVQSGLLTDAQLDEAWAQHLKSGRHLFEALDDLRYMTEDQLADEVSRFYGLPVCDLPREELEPSALDLVPEKIAREHTAFPVAVSPEGLFVAVAEPSERLAGLLAQASGQTVTMAIAKSSDIRWAIDSNYHALVGVAELVEEFEAGEGPQRRQATTSPVSDLAAESAPIVQVVNRILSQAMRDGASDVHIEPADDIVRVRNRVDGVLKVVLVLPAAMGLGLVSRIKIMADMNIVERRRPQDGKFTAMIDGREVDVRVATVATIWGETCVMRILDKTRSVLSIDDLGMVPDTHDAYSKIIRSPFGMVLCVGPTGSGKTTTLYASLTEISDVARNVMTIEDPVEYVFPSINQIQTNEQAGLTFATGLKSILRQDSDIVLVGEIRDVETARIAVQSTLTGHFVLSSLHATDAISALTRFIDMGIESFLIASSLVAIVGQRLVRRLCSACKTPYTPTDEEMAFYARSGGAPKEVFFHGAGCNFCGHTGFKDRIGVYELFRMTPEAKRLIVGFATEDELRDLAKKQGMRTIQDEAVALVTADMTTSAEVVRSIYSL